MIFPLKVKPGSKAYRKSVNVIFNFSKAGKPISVDVTKKKDPRKQLLCYQCMYAAALKVPAFKGIEYTYDNVHTMYTTKKMDDFTYVCEDIPDMFLECLGPHKGQLIISAEDVSSGQVVDLCDLSQYKSNSVLLNEDHSLRTVLEMIVTDAALATSLFVTARRNHLYRDEEVTISRGLCTRLGTKKGIRIIKIDDDYCPALVVDTVHSPFYATTPTFRDLVLRFIGNGRGNAWKDAKAFFNGIKVYPTYGQHRVLQFESFTDLPVKELVVEIKNEGVFKLIDYYFDKHTIKIEYTTMPAMIAKNNAGVYPLEVLATVPYQIVDLEVCPEDMRKAVHRQNAVQPHLRYNKILKEVEAMDIAGSIGKAFGIDPRSPISNIRELLFDRPMKPKILFGHNKVWTPMVDGKFNLFNQYYRPAKISSMAVLTRPGMGPVADKFLKLFMEKGEQCGMVFPKKNRITFNTVSDQTTFKRWNELFADFQKRDVNFVLMVGKENDIHYDVFKLCESRYNVHTQWVTHRTVSEVVNENKHITLTNILLKTNIKNRGLNYKAVLDTSRLCVSFNQGQSLVFAYDVSHPGELDSMLSQNQKEARVVGEFPSVVGIVANVLQEPASFVESFFYQQSRKEEVMTPLFVAHIKKMLDALIKNGRDLPPTVIILRDGVSEGQFNMVVYKELPLIKKACREFRPTWSPKFLVVIVTKRHRKRFLDSKLVNAPVGSFVTDKVVRPDCIEFFMACHRTINFTTKFVQVAVIHNEINVTTQELMAFLHLLCYDHQIINSPVSLPTPIYKADDAATLGRRVVQALRRESPEEIPKTDCGKLDFEALSKLFCTFDMRLSSGYNRS